PTSPSALRTRSSSWPEEVRTCAPRPSAQLMIFARGWLSRTTGRHGTGCPRLAMKRSSCSSGSASCTCGGGPAPVSQHRHVADLVAVAVGPAVHPLLRGDAERTVDVLDLDRKQPRGPD